MIRRVAREDQHANIVPLVRPTEPELPKADSSMPDTEALCASVSRALVLLLGEELRLSPQHIRSVVERELLRVRRARCIELRVHPDDLELLDQADHYRATLELRGTLDMVPDASLERGGSVLVTNLGEVDARLETRLALALCLLANGALR